MRGEMREGFAAVDLAFAAAEPVRRPDLDLPSMLRKRRLVSIERQPDVVFRQRACRGV